MSAANSPNKGAHDGHQEINGKLSLLLDANLESGPIPSATNDQESGQGAHQSVGDEESKDVPHPQSIDGKN